MTTTTTITKPTNARLLILHCVLVLLRFVSAMFGTGYVHPDEHFQSIQPAFRDVFSSGGGTDEIQSTTMVKELTHIPWEFTAKMPVRSSIAHALMGSVPYRIWLKISPTSSSTWWLFAAPRAMMTLYSLIVDFVAITIVKRISDKEQQNKSSPVRYLPLLLATSWPMFVIHARPFSNGLEATVFAMVLIGMMDSTTTYRSNEKKTAKEGLKEDIVLVLRGALIAVGIFVRFTFAIFVAPLMVFESFRFLQTPKLMMEFLRRSSIVAVSFAVVASAVAKLDAKYYERTEEEFYFAPWHALVYNVKFAGKHHGEHFRLTHLMLNGFILFGPAYALCVWKVIKETVLKKKNTKENGSETSQSLRPILYSAFASIAVLSISSHQEARFLLPAMLPVLTVASYELARLYENETPVAVKDKDTKKTSGGVRVKFSLFWLVWVTFNASVTIFYGFAHQARISSVVLDLPSFATDPDGVGSGNRGAKALVAFWRTYPPPNAFLGKDAMKSIAIKEHSQESAERFTHSMKVIDKNNKSKKEYDYYYVVAPETSIQSLKDAFGEEAFLTMKKQYLGHFNVEELAREIIRQRGLPFSLDAYTLSVYEIEVLSSNDAQDR
jgi:phosphatidylinositol glycan class Z